MMPKVSIGFLPPFAICIAMPVTEFDVLRVRICYICITLKKLKISLLQIKTLAMNSMMLRVGLKQGQICIRLLFGRGYQPELIICSRCGVEALVVNMKSSQLQRTDVVFGYQCNMGSIQRNEGISYMLG